MADQVQLGQLKRSVDRWNTLRKHNRDTRLDFSKADLTGASLEGVDFEGANLRGANLRGARLERANLTGADLSGADLGKANLYETIFADANLTDTKGLESCVHRGPSIVDHRTIGQSKNAPPNFWRGCGLSDWQIEAAKLNQPGLMQDDVISISYEVARLRGEQPIQLFSPFISYSSKDDVFARRLYDDLQSSGVRCWFAPEDMRIGDRIRRRIDEVIHLHDKLLLILSEHSVESEWVEDEVETAFEKERKTGETVLFPIKLDDTVDGIETGWAAKIRRQRNIGDFTNDDAYQASFERVLRDLRALPQ